MDQIVLYHERQQQVLSKTQADEISSLQRKIDMECTASEKVGALLLGCVCWCWLCVLVLVVCAGITRLCVLKR